MAKNLDPEVVLELTDGDPLAQPAGALAEAHELFPPSSQNLISVANSAFMVQNEIFIVEIVFKESSPDCSCCPSGKTHRASGVTLFGGLRYPRIHLSFKSLHL